jgi:hypothetical protein
VSATQGAGHATLAGRMKRRHVLWLGVLAPLAACTPTGVELGGVVGDASAPGDSSVADAPVMDSTALRRDAEMVPDTSSVGVDAAPDSGCALRSLGDGGACSLDFGLFQSAEQGCVQSAGSLGSFVPDEKCEAGVSIAASYTCCPSQPSGCSTGAFQNAAGFCSPNDELFLTGEQSCTMMPKMTITGFTLTAPCDGGASGGGMYTCCP